MGDNWKYYQFPENCLQTQDFNSMKLLYLLLLGFSFQHLSAQEGPLSAFENLLGTWVSEGKQLGGHDGKTVKNFEKGLDGAIIKVMTYTTDPQTLLFGLRNEGIRIFNSESELVEFYEFDKHGGVTKGEVIIEGKNIHYQYSYGGLTLRDSWTFMNNNEYIYTVASFKEGKQDQLHHQGVFKREE